MRKIKTDYVLLIDELENIINAIKSGNDMENTLLDLTTDYDYLNITNSQIDNLIIDSINDPKNAIYNLRWAIDILENKGAIGEEYYL